MLHVRHIKVSRNQKHVPLHTFYATSGFGPPDLKENLRHGILLATVASVLLLVGSILTWLVFTEVFGRKVPIMGPLVMSLGILLLLLALRQFYLVWKHKHNQPAAEKNFSKMTVADPQHFSETLQGPNCAYGTGEEVEDEAQGTGVLEMDTLDCAEGHHATCYSAVGPKSTLSPFSYPFPCGNAASNQQKWTKLPLLPSTNALEALSTSVIDPSFTSCTTSNLQQQNDKLTSASPSPTTCSALTIIETKRKSCSDIHNSTSCAEVAPNPRPVVHYSQGQLQLLDQEVSAAGIGGGAGISPSAKTSQHSFGEPCPSNSGLDGGSYHSLTFSMEKTDVVETI